MVTMSEALTHLTFDERMRRGGDAAVREACRFFMRNDNVYESLRRIAQRLDQLQIPYAIAGGMALVAHGYDRTTDDVDILVRPDGLQKIHQELDGLGYVPPFKGSKQLKDVDSSVRIEFLLTGQYPGDGKPKPVAFPDPADVNVEMGGIRYVDRPTLIELKLASGMTNAGRIKDLADVQELIKALRLPRGFADQLNPYVRGRFHELWDAIIRDPHEPQP
jgi:hypothetical protein